MQTESSEHQSESDKTSCLITGIRASNLCKACHTRTHRLLPHPSHLVTIPCIYTCEMLTSTLCFVLYQSYPSCSTVNSNLRIAIEPGNCFYIRKSSRNCIAKCYANPILFCPLRIPPTFFCTASNLTAPHVSLSRWLNSAASALNSLAHIRPGQ